MIGRFFTILFLVFSSTFTDANVLDLSPELKEFYTIEPLKDKDLDKNLYVGLMGIFLPQENYIDVAKDYFKKNREVDLMHPNRDGLTLLDYYSIDTFIPEGQEKLTVDLGDYDKAEIFVCLTYSNENCVTEVVKNQATLKQIVNNNKVLLNRLKALITDSLYSYGIPTAGGLATELPKLNDIRLLENIIAHEAILKISEGKIDEGLSSLALLKKKGKIYHNKLSRTTLIDEIFNALINQEDLTMVLNGLLSSGMLDNVLQDPKLSDLFFVQSLDETDYLFQRSYFYDFCILVQFDSHSLWKDDQNKFVIGFIRPALIYSAYSFCKKIITINNKGELLSKAEIKDIASEYGPSGDVIFDYIENNDIRRNYIGRQNFRRLVYLKYRIMRDKIAFKDIPKFLESMGEIAINTITKEPYQFDSKTGIISTLTPNKKGPTQNLKKQQTKNAQPEYLQVSIPKIES